ncbi:hypothetical protein W823_10305 [Williamsia sp. D3]|nr:hypothetical protein W823_10305 [Williamsia sp. D3]
MVVRTRWPEPPARLSGSPPTLLIGPPIVREPIVRFSGIATRQLSLQAVEVGVR